MEIRNMRIEDYDEVYALWSSCPGIGLNPVDDSRSAIQQYLCRNPNNCFVALEDGIVVGAIMAGYDGRRGHIGHTAVAPAYRNRGTGRRLVQAVMESFQRENIRKVNLVVFEDNQDGNVFWERMGFSGRPDLIYRDCLVIPDTAKGTETHASH